MASPVEALRAAGYSDDEVTAWATERRDALTTAGFKENEIEAFFTGGVVAPDTVPEAFVKRVDAGQRLAEIGGKVWKGMQEGYGETTATGLDDKTFDDLIRLGWFHDPAKGKPGPIQFFNETMIMSGAQVIGGVLRGLNAGVHGAGALVGELHKGILEAEGTKGVDPETEGNRLKREVINFGNWALIEAGMGRFSRPRVGREGVIDEPIGGLPKSEDFVTSAKVLTDDSAPRAVQEKLLKTYEERGVHPAEMAHDAAADPVLKQRLLSKDPQDLPYEGGKPPEKPPGEPPKPPESPEPGSFEAAQQAVLDKISIGERDGKRPWSFDRLYTEAIDDLHPLKAASEDGYQLARLTRGSMGRAEYFLEHGTFDFNTLKDTGRPLRAILEPVRDDLNGLRAYMASKRAIELEGQGRKSGFPMEEAQQVVKEGGKQYEKIASELIDYQDATLRYLRDSGVVGEDAYAAMKEANKQYIPFYRILDDGAGGPAKPGSSLGPGNPVKRLKGSERDIVDPIESIIKNTYAYVSIAERNAAGIEIVDALKSQGFKVETKRGARGVDAELTKYFDEMGVDAAAEANQQLTRLVQEIMEGTSHDGTKISAWKNGKRQEVVVKDDPDLVAAFRGLDRQSVGLLTRIFAVPARTMRAGAVLSPDFIARNMIRDFMTAFVNTKGIVFSPIDTIKGLSSVLRKDEAWGDWVKSGGANSTMVALDRAYLQESLTKLAGETGLMERGWNVVKSPLTGLRMVSELIENATRVGEFRKLTKGEVGKGTMQDAAFASREVTLDFARMGAKMRGYNMVTAFANAQIQGVDRIARAFIDRPVNTTAKVAAGITLPSVLLWWANHDDPRYQELPHWQKDLFWIIPTDKWEPISPADAAAKPPHLVRTVNGRTEFNNGSIWRIPKPFELGVIFGSGPERLLDLTIGKDKEAFDGFTKSVMEVLTPSFIPTAIQPGIEQFANRSTFIDRTLIPADMEKHLPEYQYTPYTTQLSRKLGQVVAAFPGIREASVDPGNPAGPVARAATSPILIENYVRSWSGGLGVYAMQAADLGLRKAGVLPDPITPTPTLADIPFVKAFVARYPSAGMQPVQDFYDEHQKQKAFFDTWMARAREGDTEAMTRIQDAGGPQMFVRLDAIKQVLSEHSKVIKDIYKNPDMPADEKRQLIDGLYYSMINVGRAGRDIQRAVKTPAS